MLTLNFANNITNKPGTYTKQISTPFRYQKFNNFTPLKQDTLSFTSNTKISFEDINFKEKFSTDDYKAISEITNFAQKTKTNVYLIGGIVRDMLLGKNANDIDFLIEGDAVEFTKKFNEEHPETQIEYLKQDFGTGKLKINGTDIDLASTREESYIKKAIPNVKNIGCSIEKDVKRRDFTINSMALKLKADKNGDVKFIPVDIANGLKDLNNGIIRATYQNSFNDDPTRILRGLKFRLRYGFKYDDRTKKMQEQYLINPPINEISASRVETTLRKLFIDEEIAPKAFRIIIDEQLYKLLNPEILAQSDWGDKIKYACEMLEIEDGTNIYYKALNNNIVSEIQESYFESKTNYDIYKKLHRLSKEDLALYYTVTNDDSVFKFYNELRFKKPLLKGKDLIQMGFKQGKELGTILDELLKAKLNSDDIQTIEDEKRFIEKIYKGR